MLITVHNMTWVYRYQCDVFVNITVKNFETAFSTQRLRLRLRLANRKRNRKRVVAKPNTLRLANRKRKRKRVVAKPRLGYCL